MDAHTAVALAPIAFPIEVRGVQSRERPAGELDVRGAHRVGVDVVGGDGADVLVRPGTRQGRAECALVLRPREAVEVAGEDLGGDGGGAHADTSAWISAARDTSAAQSARSIGVRGKAHHMRFVIPTWGIAASMAASMLARPRR